MTAQCWLKRARFSGSRRITWLNGRACLAGLEAALELGVDDLVVRLDSELVVRQLTGVYRVKHADLIPLHRKAQVLLRRFRSVEIGHVRRKDNAAADALVNRLLDEAAAGR